MEACWRNRNLTPVPVPAETDYTMRLESMEYGVASAVARCAGCEYAVGFRSYPMG